MISKSILFAIGTFFAFENAHGALSAQKGEKVTPETENLQSYLEIGNKVTDEHIELFTDYANATIAGNRKIHADKIEYINLAFQIKSYMPLDVAKARKLLIRGSQDLLYRVNCEESLKPGLQTYPFGPLRVGYCLFFVDKDGEVYLARKGKENSNLLTSCEFSDGRITYSVNSSSRHYKIICEETYEEALEIVKNESPEFLLPLQKGEHFGFAGG